MPIYFTNSASPARIVFVRSDDGSLTSELSQCMDPSLQKWLISEMAENRLECNQAIWKWTRKKYNITYIKYLNINYKHVMLDVYPVVRQFQVFTGWNLTFDQSWYAQSMIAYGWLVADSPSGLLFASPLPLQDGRKLYWKAPREHEGVHDPPPGWRADIPPFLGELKWLLCQSCNEHQLRDQDHHVRCIGGKLKAWSTRLGFLLAARCSQ